MTNIRSKGEVVLTVPTHSLPQLCRVLQYGFGLTAPDGASVAAILVSLGLTAADLECIQTIFLDSSPVDDLERACVRPDSVLALSAAMPGLVGAVMRRAGAFAKLRESITHHNADSRPGTDGTPVPITVKVFNLLQDRLGPRLLGRGVLMACDRLGLFLDRLGPEFWRQCREVRINGLVIDHTQYQISLPQTPQPALFRVESPGDPPRDATQPGTKPCTSP